MTERELKRLEETLLSEHYEPECSLQENDGSKIMKGLRIKLERSFRYNPKQTIAKLTSILLILISVHLLLTIIFPGKKQENDMPARTEMEQTAQQEDTGNALSGFEQLAEADTDTGQNPSTEETTPEEAAETASGTVVLEMEDVTSEGTETEVEEETAETATGGYYASPEILSAVAEDNLFQLGTEVYKLPVKISELESAGISLVVLGAKPPEEDFMLQPMQRNGYIQFGTERYLVKLTNGEDCTYHELNVIAITAEDEAGSFYAAGGVHIGMDEEALDKEWKTSYNEITKYKFYTKGGLEGSAMFADLSGEMTEYTVHNKKVIKIHLFNDNSIAD